MIRSLSCRRAQEVAGSPETAYRRHVMCLLKVEVLSLQTLEYIRKSIRQRINCVVKFIQGSHLGSIGQQQAIPGQGNNSSENSPLVHSQGLILDKSSSEQYIGSLYMEGIRASRRL